ncbi:MAG: hypothetical protein ABR600_01890 [Actinomycetota bacterium]
MDVPTDDGGGAGAGGHQPVCPVGFCPIGFALTAADQVRPEVVEHLLAAGREMMLAMKAFMDAQADRLGRESPIEKIEIS